MPRHQEEVEVLLVGPANSVAQPGAMVIHPQHLKLWDRVSAKINFNLLCCPFWSLSYSYCMLTVLTALIHKQHIISRVFKTYMSLREAESSGWASEILHQLIPGYFRHPHHSPHSATEVGAIWFEGLQIGWEAFGCQAVFKLGQACLYI